MADPGTWQFARANAYKRLPADIEQQILRAISRIDYGSIEVVVHDGRVVQIECREKIRVTRDEHGRKGTAGQIG